jgi:hypothetical protein
MRAALSTGTFPVQLSLRSSPASWNLLIGAVLNTGQLWQFAMYATLQAPVLLQVGSALVGPYVSKAEAAARASWRGRHVSLACALASPCRRASA